MLDSSSEAMRKEIHAFSQRLQDLKEELQERGKLSDAAHALWNEVQQHKDQLETKFSGAERTGSWASIRKEFVEDWNSLVVDVVALENQLYQ
jgi:predicted  nucleic acid-binding Zn-ribbon protein